MFIGFWVEFFVADEEDIDLLWVFYCFSDALEGKGQVFGALADGGNDNAHSLLLFGGHGSMLLRVVGGKLFGN